MLTACCMAFGRQVLAFESTQSAVRIICSVGTSGGLRVGQSVFAIGSPYGYGKSLSAGVVR